MVIMMAQDISSPKTDLAHENSQNTVHLLILKSMKRQVFFIIIGFVVLFITIIGYFTSSYLIALYHINKGGVYIHEVIQSIGDENAVTTYCFHQPLSKTELDNVQRARGHLLRALDFKDIPSFAYAYLQLGRANCLLDRPIQAIKAYKNYITMRPNNPLGYIELAISIEARCIKEQNNNYGATTNAISAQLNCENDDLRNSAALAWQKAGVTVTDMTETGDDAKRNQETTSALSWYHRATWIFPQDSRGWIAYGRYLSSLEETHEAIDVFKTASIVIPQNKDIWYELGKACVEDKKYTEAITAFENGLMATEGNAGKSNFYYMIGKIKQSDIQPKNPSGAMEAYTYALLTNDFPIDKWQEASTHVQRGILYAQKGEWQTALEDYQKAIALRPNSFWTLLNTAIAYQNLGEYNKALECAKRANEENPTHIRALMLLGEIYQALGDNINATNTYYNVLELEPGYQDAIYILEKLNK